jgi:hypothetical protein
LGIRNGERVMLVPAELATAPGVEEFAAVE